MVELTQFVIPIFQIIASGATAIALGIAIWVYHRNRRTEQIRLVESIYKDIRELERERAHLSIRDSDSTNIETWRSRFFNTLEWLSFLANEKEIKRDLITKFFKEFIVQCYEQIYLKRYGQDKIDDPSEFPQFKKLYSRIKSGCYD